MRSVLDAIRSHPKLKLQLIATGMHLDPRYGRPLAAMKEAGFAPDVAVAWPASSEATEIAAATGRALASMARKLSELESDIVLVTGDRVEAFAGAAAAHLSRRVLAHVHGGDRALGQVDDSLRHSITKLAHVHFAATAESAGRIARLGEDRWRIHPVGSPGNDGIAGAAASREEVSRCFPWLTPGRFALLLLHPVDADDGLEGRRARLVVRAVRGAGIGHVVVVYPNSDPGSQGIIEQWQRLKSARDVTLLRDVARDLFLGLVRDAVVLAGNSSSGIIEAGAFSTPVIDIGPRQAGRERSRNVVHCEYDAAEIGRALTRIWNRGRPRRREVRNVYGGDGAGRRIADILAGLDLARAASGKLITY
jgi:UDP-N-acetylglucosamine 2-epimerase (non-hydrolysing)/GDP/UDP-N,N'-diacetylbacillosamine 2-epimerase (hydrolysing)